MLLRTSGLFVRMVPVITTDSGMMLLAIPPLIEPTLTTPMPLVRSLRRLMSVCRPSTIFALATIGSVPVQGAEPWVCCPLMVMRNSSSLFSAAPGL
ncbi:hypothetical protein D3C81_1733920 [compost metagenome]